MEIRETLDTRTSFRKWLHGNGMEAKYSFAMARTLGGLKMAEQEYRLEGTSDERRKYILEEFGTEKPTGFQFIVEFSRLEAPGPVWVNQIEIDTQKVVEMHFGRSECKLEYQPMINPALGGGRLYWRNTTEYSDRDEGDLSTKDALQVFAGISQVAARYYQDFAPDGIVMSTREDSKDGRARIYRRIAERLASEKGAIVTSISPIRWDMKSPTLVWFPKILR